MGKYAVTVGVNYTKNPEAALKGCVNDSHIMKSILLSKGFEECDIKMLNDEDSGVEAPTGANVKKALDWLCTGRSADDIIFFHFSGHGTQIPADDDDEEEDGKDEALCLESLFLLADDDLKQFFTMLPEGCQATVITDCCHSGSMLDHTAVAISGDKADDGMCEPSADAQSGVARSLPIGTIAQFLSSKLGGKPVSPTASGINGGLASIFGGDAGKLAMQFAASQAGGKPGSNPLAALLASAGGGGGGAAGAALGIAAMALGGGGNKAGGSASPLTAILDGLGLGGSESATKAGAPPYKPTDNPLSDDVGILITGCMAEQTSADVRPPGGKAYGALTNAVKTTYDQNPDATYKELVLNVRKMLLASGFSQSPQLECSVGNADLPFICGGGSRSGEPAPRPPAAEPSAEAGPSAPAAEAPGGANPAGIMKLFKACFKG